MTVRNTTGTSCSESALRSASMSMLPLKGCREAGTRASAIGMSRATAPLNSVLARVVSKWVLFGMTFPGPPSALNRIFSAARPW